MCGASTKKSEATHQQYGHVAGEPSKLSGKTHMDGWKIDHESKMSLRRR